MGELCIGSAQFGMTYGIANRSGAPDVTEVAAILKQAVEHGVSLVDTAQSYGQSEAVLGQAMSQAEVTGLIRCITKLAPDLPHDDFAAIDAAVDASLRHLGQTALYGLLVHHLHRVNDWQALISIMDRLKSAGRMQKFGVSLYHPEEALHFAELPGIDIIQIPMNILDRRFLDTDFFELAHEHNITVFIRSIYLQGLILMEEQELIDKNMPWAVSPVAHLKAFSREHGIEVNALALQAVARRLPECNIIIGLETFAQLEDNLKIWNAPPLDSKVVNLWWSSLKRYPDQLLNPTLWQ